MSNEDQTSVTDLSYLEKVAPTHRCTVCNAHWRYWPKRDTGRADSWSLISNAAGACCDNTLMEQQVVPVTYGDLLAWFRARFAVDAMMQHVLGPKADDGVH